jgi:ABC-type anion transport system duplicated permease subunit
MFKNMNFRDKIAVSGITVLGIGVTLLIFTFISAFGFLGEGWQILSTQDLVQTFGEALGPLIATSIRVMYLGVIGSLITIRGVTIMNNAPKAELGIPQPQAPQPQREAAKSKDAKAQVKSVEPEMVVIPLEEMEQQQQRSS